MSTVSDTLDGLKRRLDASGKLAVQYAGGKIHDAGFIFNEPVQENELASYPFIPEEYKQFLRLHNGAGFYSDEYGDAFYLHSLEKVLLQYSFFKENHIVPNGDDWLPIGGILDIGELCIDLTHPKRHVLLHAIPVYSFLCPFDEWLDRMVQANGATFWQWCGKELTF